MAPYGCRLFLLLTLTACDRSPREAKTDSAVPAPLETGITVCVERRDSVVIYHYTVRNGPRALLRAFDIGLGAGREADSSDAPDGGGELTRHPAGARIDWSGDGRLSPPAVTSPPHWFAEAKRVEETSGFFIAWYADSTHPGIQPGAALGGFSVAIPGGDTAYATGHWTLLVDAPTHSIGRLRPSHTSHCPQQSTDAPQTR